MGAGQASSTIGLSHRAQPQGLNCWFIGRRFRHFAGHHSAAILAPDLRGKNVSIEVDCRIDSPWVHGDVVQLSQVVLNLMRNALQAKRPGSALTLTIRVRETDGWLVADIEDNGSGMSEADLQRWDMPFFTTKPDGLGVGLSISRRILEHHGGSLHLSRAASGQGVCATLRLPKSQPPTLG